MNTEILGVALQILLLIVISYPLGKHIAKVYKEGNDCMRFMAPIERFIYKLAGINPNEEMDWKVFLKSLLIINVFWFFWGMILLVSQGYLPLNPDGNSGQSPDLAFNTCISFMVNCNLQHYSGESGLTYFTQLFVIMLFQFITAATGMAAMAGIMKSMAAKTTKTIGNFWHYLVTVSYTHHMTECISYIHFAPDIEVLAISSTEIRTNRANIAVSGANSIEIINDFVSVEYNRLEPSKTIKIVFCRNLTYQIFQA